MTWIPPSFDDWFKHNNSGFSFDAVNMQMNTPIQNAFYALVNETKNYVTYVAQETARQAGK